MVQELAVMLCSEEKKQKQKTKRVWMRKQLWRRSQHRSSILQQELEVSHLVSENSSRARMCVVHWQRRQLVRDYSFIGH